MCLCSDGIMNGHDAEDKHVAEDEHVFEDAAISASEEEASVCMSLIGYGVLRRI